VQKALSCYTASLLLKSPHLFQIRTRFTKNHRTWIKEDRSSQCRFFPILRLLPSSGQGHQLQAHRAEPVKAAPSQPQ
jgi:hypothetical protein